MHPETTLLALFAIAAAVAILSHRLRVPYTIALVVAGLALGFFEVLEAPHLTKELLFLIVLPGLLFEAAFHMSFKEFWKAKVSIFSLAVPGLMAAIGLTGLLVFVAVDGLGLGEVTLLEAMVFGTLIGATDPISVLAIFKALGVDRRLYTLVEGESLFNDGTAVVIFTILLGVVLGGEASLGSATFEFVKVVGMALLIGGAMGWLGSMLTKTLEEPVIEITLTALVAYGSFIIAEHFHFSGVIACVVAGMISGSWGARIGMSASTRLAVVSFWDYAAFVLNSLVFLLVGFEVKIGSLVSHAGAIVLAWLAVLLSRAIVVFGKGLILRAMKKEAPPWSWSVVLTWGGLRGGLSMVLALALPREFEHRELILHLTFGVVLISLLLQGLTMKPLLSLLGLSGKEDDRQDYEERTARLKAARAALRELEALRAEHTIPSVIHDQLHGELEQELAELQKAIDDLTEKRVDILDAEVLALRRHLLQVRKEAVHETHRQGTIGEPVMLALQHEIDDRLLDLAAAEHEGGEH
ncbi:MAG: Na+/H+ antiporter [Deltaproteobacteria bacterium]|nr:Na+/H+ antiporter [Deltaproteobacteria bacterium]